MPDELWEALKEDAEAQNRMAAEHVREICREYLQEETGDIRDRLDAVESRLDVIEDIDQRLDRQQEVIERQNARIAQLEQRLDQLTSGTPAEAGAVGSAEAATTSGPEATEEAGSPAAPESTEARRTVEEPDVVETIDDAIQMARAQFIDEYDPEQAEKMAEAAQAALEELQANEEMFAKDFREELADEYALQEQSEAEWWRETAEPALDIAESWGLVFNEHGHEYEWIGPPAGSHH